MYRMQIYDERTAGMHWQTHKQGAEHYRRLRAHGQTRMDVAVAIGADPATMFSAILPLPPDLDEMPIAGFLRGSPVEMVKCQTCDLEVPAQDVNVQDTRDVAWKVPNNIDPERDIQFTMGPIDSLDHSSRLPNYGSKMGVDATRKWPEEGFIRPWPGVIKMSDEVKGRVDELWRRAGL